MGAPMDAEDLKMETDALEKDLQGRKEEIDQQKVQAEVDSLKAQAKQGKHQEAIDGLLVIEKSGRLGEDIFSARVACSAIIEVK
jgi:hypothetical protein